MLRLVNFTRSSNSVDLLCNKHILSVVNLFVNKTGYVIKCALILLKTWRYISRLLTYLQAVVYFGKKLYLDSWDADKWHLVCCLLSIPSISDFCWLSNNTIHTADWCIFLVDWWASLLMSTLNQLLVRDTFMMSYIVLSAQLVLRYLCIVVPLTTCRILIDLNTFVILYQ